MLISFKFSILLYILRATIGIFPKFSPPNAFIRESIIDKSKLIPILRGSYFSLIIFNCEIMSKIVSNPVRVTLGLKVKKLQYLS